MVVLSLTPAISIEQDSLFLRADCLLRDYADSFTDDLVDGDGSPNWCEAPSCSYGIVGLV